MPKACDFLIRLQANRTISNNKCCQNEKYIEKKIEQEQTIDPTKHLSCLHCTLVSCWLTSEHVECRYRIVGIEQL